MSKESSGPMADHPSLCSCAPVLAPLSPRQPQAGPRPYALADLPDDHQRSTRSRLTPEDRANGAALVKRAGQIAERIGMRGVLARCERWKGGPKRNGAARRANA